MTKEPESSPPAEQKILWPNDKLDRQKESEFLSKYLIEKYKKEDDATDSFVLNINADWGFGKTYFLENWSETIKSMGYPVVFFNAWDSDYYDDPLIAFICELETQLDAYFKKDKKVGTAFQATIKSGFKLLKIGVPIIGSILAKKLTGYTLDQIIEKYQTTCEDANQTNDNREEIENAVSQIFVKSTEDAIRSYEQSKGNIKKFTDQLKDLIVQAQSSDSIKAPLFIFIDELDRCRPTYAIEILEKIKHIFNVPGVYFIVATASNQLCHAIRSIYGHNFDAEGYLKRFFNQIYEFKEPDYFEFTTFLFNKYHLNKFEDQFFTPLDDNNCKTGNRHIEIFALLSAWFKLGLRDQMQIANNLYTICLTWWPGLKLHLSFMIFLLMLKHKKDDVFKSINEIHGFGNDPKIIDFLKTAVDNTLRFNDLQWSTHNGGSKKPCTVKSIIDEYLATIAKKVFDMEPINRINNFEFKLKINAELISIIRDGRLKDTGTDILSLSIYFDHVKQLGQFKKDFDKQE